MHHECSAHAWPWERRCVDLIGPHKAKRKSRGVKIKLLRCVAMIDPAAGWLEIAEHDDKKSITVANIVEKQWLIRYPLPSLATLG